MKTLAPSSYTVNTLVPIPEVCPCCGLLGKLIPGDYDYRCTNAFCDVRTYRIRTTTKRK
jgi:hypothetical protein